MPQKRIFVLSLLSTLRENSLDKCRAGRHTNEKCKDMSRRNTQGRGQGQIFEDKYDDEDKLLASRPTCPRGLNITGIYPYLPHELDYKFEW